MEEYYVDLSGISDKAGLHRRLREHLPLPPWYGNNLDALYDSLTEMPVPSRLHFLSWEDALGSMPSYFKGFCHLLLDVQQDNPGLSVVFEGPAPSEGEQDE